MPIRRKLEEAVPILLPLLDEMIKGLNDQDPAFDRLENIKGYFEEKKILFPNLKIVGDNLLKKFTELEEEIDNSKYTSADGLQGTPRHHPKKLDSIEEIFKSITDLISQFQRLPEEIRETSQKAESDAQEREISKEWSALNVEDRILASPAMSNLQLNYDILDLQMKLCLLCFSVFPAKSVIKKRPLVYWWIGEGFVTKTKDKTAMEEGDRIFGELINKGFLIPQYKPCKKDQDKNPIVDSCTMHSWIRLMLIRVARTAKLFDSDAPASGPGTTSRSMCLVKQTPTPTPTQTPPTPNVSAEGPPRQPADPATEAGADHDTSRLLTLFNVNEQYLNIPHDWFSKENKIVVLQLGSWQDSATQDSATQDAATQNSAKHHIEVENEDFLKALGTKKHLKYLSLRGISRITEIPSSIRKLINLEILDLRACHNLEKLPSDISSLRKLTHLDISGCHLLESMPKGLDKLASLQVLKGFVVATSKRGRGRLGDVAGLKKLRKLSIYIRSDAYIEEEELNNLKKVSNLRILSITWGGVVQASTHPSGKPATIARRKSFTSKKDRQHVNRADILTMESLSFPQKLEKLDLWCIPSKTKPAWLNPGKFESLNKLYIRGGKLDSFSFEGNNKWNVRILRLKYLLDLKVDEKKLRDDFPHLIYLEIANDKIKKDKGENEHGASSQQQQQVLND